MFRNLTEAYICKRGGHYGLGLWHKPSCGPTVIRSSRKPCPGGRSISQWVQRLQVRKKEKCRKECCLPDRDAVNPRGLCHITKTKVVVERTTTINMFVDAHCR